MEIAEHGRIAPAFVGIVAPVPLAGAVKKRKQNYLNQEECPYEKTRPQFCFLSKNFYK
jgi:hypothetical protein